jgi:hypothetical protein
MTDNNDDDPARLGGILGPLPPRVVAGTEYTGEPPGVPGSSMYQPAIPESELWFASLAEYWRRTLARNDPEEIGRIHDAIAEVAGSPEAATEVIAAVRGPYSPEAPADVPDEPEAS